MYLAQIKRVFEVSERYKIVGPTDEGIFCAEHNVNGVSIHPCFSMVLNQNDSTVSLLSANEYWIGWFNGVKETIDRLNEIHGIKPFMNSWC